MSEWKLFLPPSFLRCMLWPGDNDDWLYSSESLLAKEVLLRKRRMVGRSTRMSCVRIGGKSQTQRRDFYRRLIHASLL